jgi:hypothetical protein
MQKKSPRARAHTVVHPQTPHCQVLEEIRSNRFANARTARSDPEGPTIWIERGMSVFENRPNGIAIAVASIRFPS